MGNWHMRAVGALVVAVLAGGPSIALLCDALCSGRHHETAATGTTHGPGDHTSAAHEPAAHAVRAGGHVTTGGHDHRQSPVMATATVPASETRLHGSPERESCSTHGQPGVSLTAVRADTNLLSTPQAAEYLAAGVFDAFDRHGRSPLYAPPPGATAPAQTTLVLRI